MSAEDFKLQREVAKQAVASAVARLERAVAERNERRVENALTKLDAAMEELKERHTQYLLKAKRSPSHPEEVNILIEAEETVEGPTNNAEDFLHAYRAANKAQVRGHKNTVVYTNQSELLGNSTKMLVEHLTMLEDNIGTDQGLLPDVLEAEVIRCENKMLADITTYRDKIGVLEEADELELRAAKFAAEREKEFRARVLSLRNKSAKVSRPAAGGRHSATASRDNSPSRSSIASSIIKPKKLEFPKFGGDLRAYTTFKKDFQETVVDPGVYNNQQMSLILRTECLQGEARGICKNITNLEDLWDRLDDVYHDPQKLVEIITRQLSEQKKIGDKDYGFFIKYVDTIERAYLDLSATGNLEVMNNPMTCRVIETKCPEWIQIALGSKRTESNEADKDGFAFMYKFLKDKRKEARKLTSLKESEKDKSTAPTRDRDKRSSGVANLAQSNNNGRGPGPGSGGWTCIVTGCNNSSKHFLGNCATWRALDVDGKGRIVAEKKLCVLCFSPNHLVADCPKKAKWKKCDLNNCDKWHSRFIHGASVPGLVLRVDGVMQEVALLISQDVKVQHHDYCRVLWDGGATISLVTNDFAEGAGFEGSACPFSLTVVRDITTRYDTMLYKIPIVDREGNVYDIMAYGIDKISSPGYSLQMEDKDGQLDLRAADLKEPEMLIGLDYINLHPSKYKEVGRLAVLTSAFGTGVLVAGGGGGSNMAQHAVFGGSTSNMPRCFATAKPPVDFLTAEGFGVDLPKRCKACKGCKECSFKAVHLSWQENTELKMIEDGLTFDINRKKWTAAYPYKTDPSALVNNYGQARAMMTNLEKRLKKQSMIEDFNVQFKETVDRGVFKKIESDDYEGPVNYISIVDAYKQGPHSTTPIRLCMNSSLKYAGNSLNDLLYKGPDALNSLYGVLLDFRRHKVGMVKDLSKFYQSVEACERDQHLRRVMWRYGDESVNPDVFLTTTVNFGDRPAGCVAQVALRETANMYRAMHPEAADVITTSTYCDDSLTGAQTHEDAKVLSKQMDDIVAQGGFKYKNVIMTGDKTEEGEERKVLGTCWDTERDLLFIDCKINFSKKRKGLRTGPDLEPEKIQDLAPDQVTKRMIWRVALGQYDVLGLISPFLIKLKLIMRELSKPEEPSKASWDSPVSEDIRSSFLTAISQLSQVKALRFPRCIVPEGCENDSNPVMMIMVDGSKSAFCALVYGRWMNKNGSFECRLITGKTRVAPIKKISVPRMELQGAVAGVRLAAKVQDDLQINFSKRCFFTDSTAVLGMLRGDMSTFQEFVGTRVSEIKSKSDAQTEWNWIPTDKNLADLGTRANAAPADLDQSSDYQNGMSWMKEEEASWPTQFKTGAVPEEEKLKSARIMLASRETHSTGDFIEISKYSNYAKLITVTSVVFFAVKKFKEKRKKKQAIVATRDATNTVKMNAAGHVEEAKRFWFLWDQWDQGMKKKFDEGQYQTLRARLLKLDNLWGLGEMIVVSGRLGEQLTVGYDKTELPLLETKSRLAVLIMKDAHCRDHAGVDSTLHTSRLTAWIVRGGILAKRFVRNCFKCKLKNKALASQIMAPVPEQRVPPSPPFGCTAVDLFGPYKVRDSVKKRVTRETYGVMFTCMTTTAIHIESTDDYSTDSFLLALRRFMSLRGTPVYIQSDPGTQVKAAGKEVELWRCEGVKELAAKKKIEWKIIPTAAQHCNGLAERMIGITKKVLCGMLKESVLTKGELDTLFAEVVQMVNSRPLMLKAKEDPDSMGPITPNHLLHGRATADVPEVQFSHQVNLTRRLRFIQEVKDQFWKKWIVQVFPHLVPCYKWRKEQRNMQPGDVVLIKDESRISNTYKLGKVAEVMKGEDGKVRKARVEYKNVQHDTDIKKAPWMSTERSVHGLAVIVPVDYTQEEIDSDVSKDIVFEGLK